MASKEIQNLDAKANAIFKEMNLDPDQVIGEPIVDLTRRITPALLRLEGNENGKAEDRIKGFAQTLVNKAKQGEGLEKSQAKFYLAQAILMGHIIQGRPKEGDQVKEEAVIACEEIKLASKNITSYLSSEQRGLFPLEANGFQQLFRDFSKVKEQIPVTLYNALTRGTPDACKGVLTFLGTEIESEWHLKFPQLMRNLEK